MSLNALIHDNAEANMPSLPAHDAAPILTALADQGGVVAMLTGIEGRFYRRLGAIMAVLPDGTPVGQLSGGCVEGDIALHAAELTQAGDSKVLRYGAGSPYFDIRLPCGSGIEVTLLRLNADAVRPHLDALAQRRVAVLEFASLPVVRVEPEIRIMVMGVGEESRVFTALASAAGYDVIETLSPKPDDIDSHSAVVLFFHDHHRETALLETALKSPAFWIGAQGSRLSQQRRLDTLRARGAQEMQVSRIHGPIGLIPQVRDPRALAISVLAEIAAAQP